MDRSTLLAHLRRTRFAPGDREHALSDAHAIAEFFKREYGARVYGVGSLFDDERTFRESSDIDLVVEGVDPSRFYEASARAARMTDLAVELESIVRLGDELAAAPDSDNTFGLRARGSILHDFYTGVERVLIRLAEEINGGVPRGDQWQRQLLRDMAIAIPSVRPAVISTDLADDLDEFLRFRHVFRNMYGFVLQPDRLRVLQQKLPGVLDRFVAEVRTFASWLAGDET